MLLLCSYNMQKYMVNIYSVTIYCVLGCYIVLYRGCGSVVDLMNHHYVQRCFVFTHQWCHLPGMILPLIRSKSMYSLLLLIRCYRKLKTKYALWLAFFGNMKWRLIFFLFGGPLLIVNNLNGIDLLLEYFGKMSIDFLILQNIVF